MKFSVVMAIVLGVLLVIFMPPIVPRHKFHLDNNFSAPNRMYAYYADSTGQVTDMSFIRKSTTSITLESDDNRLYNIRELSYEEYQNIYLPISPPERDWVFIEDVNSDGTKEILYVSQENDSTHLYVSNNKSYHTERVLTLPINGRLMYRFFRFYYFGDSETVYFSLASKMNNTTFETGLYAYHYATNAVECVFKSPTLLVGYQFDGFDQKVLLINKVNKRTTFTSVDLLTGSSKSFVANPLDISMFYSRKNIHEHPYSFDDEMLMLHNGDSLFYADINELFVDNKLKRCFVQKIDKPKEMLRLKYINNNIVYFTLGDKYGSDLYKYNDLTNKTRHLRIKGNPIIGTIIYSGDLDSNGKNDIVFTDRTNASEAFCIYEEGSYSDICRYPVDREKLKVANCAVQGDSVLFQSNGIEYVIRYSKNAEYYKHWIWCGVSFFVIVIIGLLLQKNTEIRAYKRRETSSKIIHLQLENIQKRIDPHFIFNSLNNLGSLILEGKSNESYDYLSKVSSVLYKALRNRNILVTIEEELNFCISVLDTQRKRFDGKFDYEIFIDKDVDVNCLMPSNILNSMADNCIKHGFAGIEYLGLITVEFLKQEQGILMAVEDNGKGFDAAQVDKDQAKSTGTGLEICHQYVNLFNRHRKHNFLYFKIVDLYNDTKQPRGTRCEFFVPDDMMEEE
ncbi:MAG: histidine kinase [Bacteroidales bacterium]|nr:histidine kinase [Bacteroidales bacterium]